MKKLFSLLLLLTMLLTTLTACFRPGEGTDREEEDGTPPVINVYTLNGTTGFGMAKMISDNKNNKLYDFSVQTDAAVVLSALASGEVDIAALPTNAASTVYNRTGGKVKLLAVNTLGCLYLLTKDGVSINSFADLKGKTVYAPAQNPTFIFTELCKKNGLNIGTDITIDSTSFAQPAALQAAVAAGQVDIAVLPEPIVTVTIASAKKAGITINNAMDLTAEWDKVHDKGSLVQGCIVVRTEFLEKYPTAVKNFLAEYEKSIQYLNANPKEASQKIVEAGIFANASVAEKAIPKCNVCYLTGAEMKAAMEVYLTVLKGINANAIGGKLPGDDFYYNAK